MASDRSIEVDALIALYTADRNDGSSIFTAAMQLAAVWVAYGTLAFAGLASDFLHDAPWIRAFIALPMWSLAGFQLLLLALTATRVNSIRILERKLLRLAITERTEAIQIGSDAGNWATNLEPQPWWLKVQTVVTYGGMWLGVLTLSGYAWHTVHGAARWLAGIIYASLGILAFCTAIYTFVFPSRFMKRLINRKNFPIDWPDDIQEASLPLSGRILQWRNSDRTWRSLASREDAADSDFQPWTGDAGVLIQADADVWQRPSWLVAWGELPESGRVEVLRTDGRALELTIVGCIWACEWIGQGEPITVQYDDGPPQTVRIDRPDFL